MPAVTPVQDAAKSTLQRIFPAILVAYAALIFACGLVIDGTRGRTFFHPEVKRHVSLGFLVFVVCVFVITYGVTLRMALRTAWSWKSRLLMCVMYLFVTLRWSLFFCVLPISVTEALFYHLPRTPVVFQTTVMESDRYRNRGAFIQTATFAGPDGERIRVTQSEWKPLRLFTAPILVNGLCPLGALPPGLPITVHGRRSSLGFALDRITSAEDCHGSTR